MGMSSAVLFSRLVFFVWLFSECFAALTTKTVCNITESPGETLADCSNRNLTYIPRDLPTTLTYLDLSNNIIREITNDSFTKYILLEYISVTHCNLLTLHPAAFSSVKELRTLDLSYNWLKTESFIGDLFRPLQKLETLDLSSNNIEQDYPDSVLGWLHNLKHITIPGVYRPRFGQGFSNFKKLESIEFQPCNIEFLKNDTFESFRRARIKTFSFVSCQFKDIPKELFQPLLDLDEINIIDNRKMAMESLFESFYSLQNRSITTLNVNDNKRIASYNYTLNKESAKYLGNICVKHFSLVGNRITTIKNSFFSSQRNKHCYESIDMSNNPLVSSGLVVADLKILVNLKFFSIAGLKAYDQSRAIPNVHLPKSIYQNSTINIDFPMSLVTFNASLCRMRFDQMNSSNINITGENMKRLYLGNSHMFNCRYRFLGPVSLEVFNMAGWDCSIMNPNIITSLTSLRVLEASGCKLASGLTSDPSIFLRGLVSLQDVDFSNNGFVIIDERIFKDQFNSLRVLRLADNRLDHIGTVLDNFKKLGFIDLRNNHLSTITKQERESLEKLRNRTGKLSILLEGNPLQCTCDDLDFIDWLFSNITTIDNNGNFSCYFNGRKTDTLFVYQNIANHMIECVSKFWLIFLACSLTFLLTVLGISCSMYRYRYIITRWQIIWRRNAQNYQQIPRDYIAYRYDAFVAYHGSNYQWVCHDVLNFLEIGNRFNICVRDRDFLPGDSIADDILDAINESRKIILVLSKQFLTSSWAHFEMEISRIRMFKECRNMIIVVLLEDISRDEMPPLLIRLSDQVTCLKWSDATSGLPGAKACFWECLCDAMKTDTPLL